MKNTILVIGLLFLVILSPLMAADPTDPYNPNKDDGYVYEQTAEPFEATNIWSLSMGGAGLGMKGYSESFLKNPANLPGTGFQLSIPGVTITGHNIRKMLESSMIDDFASGDPSRMMSGGLEFLSLFEQGYGDFLTTDITLLSMNVGGLGVALQAQERLMTYKPTYNATSISLIAQFTTAATVGFGYNIPIIDKWLDIDLGVNARFIYKGYLEGLNGDSIMGDIFDEESGGFDVSSMFLGNRALMVGWSLPITIGANVNGPWGFSLSMVGRNFNSKQYMTAFTSLDDWALQNFGQSISGGEGTTEPTIGDFEVAGQPTFDLGFTWSKNFGNNLLHPTISLDFVDFGQMANLSGDDLTRAFWSTTRFGASVRVLNIFDLRYGLNKGYHSIGVGLDLFVFHLDVAYYTKEYDERLGNKPIDALSLRIGLISR